MKCKCCISVGAVAALWLAMDLAPVRAGLVITEVLSSSAHPGGPANGDFWELTNNSATAVSLNGYSWDDDSVTPGAAVFPNGITILPDESVLFVEESVANLAGWRSAWGISLSQQVFSNAQFTGVYSGLGSAGDQVNVYDAANQLVTSVTFGAATAGVSFEWNFNGGSLGLSVGGENGAYQAFNNGASGAGVDIGSPGRAVPEPSSVALAILGAVCLFAFKRRG